MLRDQEADFILQNNKVVYPPVSTDGLELYYDVKGKKNSDLHKDKLLDMSGNDRHGELQSFSYKNLSGYQEDSELVFDGIDDTLKMPKLNGIDANNFTYQLNNNILAFTGDEVKTVKNGNVEVGGRNLLPQSGNFESKPSHSWTDNGGGLTFDNSITHNGYGTIKTSLGRGIRGKWLKLENGVEYTYSVLIRSETPFKGSRSSPIHYHAGRDNANQVKITVTNYMTSYTSQDVGKFKKIWITFKLTGDADSFRPLLYGPHLADDVNIAYLKLEKGNKATDWTPTPEDLIETTDLKGNIFGDMEDIIDDHTRDEQSGVEVFTDKADDSLVRVEIDGKSYQEPSVGLTNLVQNGDFREGFNGWSLSGSPKIVNGRAHLKRLAGESLVSISYQDRTIFDDKDDVYYFAAQGEVITFNSGAGGIMINDSNNLLQVWTLSQQPKSVLSRSSRISNLSSNVSPYVHANTNSNGVEYYIDYVMVINLTKEFGAGNEPTKEQMDAIIELNGYFEGKKLLRTGNILLSKDNAPSPDYPIEIHSLNDFDVVSQKSEGGMIDGIEVGGRNLFSLSRMKRYIGSSLRDDSHVAFPNIEDNRIIVNKKPISSYPGQHVDSSSNKEFTISGESSSNSPMLMYIHELGDDNTVIRGQYSYTIHPSGGKYSNTFKVNQNTTHFYLGVGHRGDDWWITVKLEKGNKATDWTPAPEDMAEESNHPLIDKINLLLSEPLRSVGDVKDRLFKDSDGLWKIERNVGEYTTDGTDYWAIGKSGRGWNVSGDTLPFYSSTPLNKMNPARTINATTNRFTVGRNNTSSIVKSDSEGFSLGYASWGVIFRINKNRLSTENRAGFTEWIVENPVTIIYGLANPTIETLDQELQDKLNNLRSFQDSNYVYTIINDSTGLPSHISENLKPTIHTEFLAKDHYKENRTVNNLLIWNRSLEDEELLDQNKLFHERFNMKSNTVKGEPINQEINLTQGGYVANTLSLEYTIEI